MRFPFYTLFLREVSSCGFHFTHLFSVQYLHAISILHTFSPSSISMRFHFTHLFVPKNGVAVFKLNWQCCNLCY